MAVCLPSMRISETLCKPMFLIEGAKIAAVRPNLAAANAETIDASNRIVMLGFTEVEPPLACVASADFAGIDQTRPVIAVAADG